MTTYNKASAGATVEIDDGTILPVDVFGTIEVNLEQPGAATCCDQASEDGCRRVCAGTFVESAVHPQSNVSMG